MSDNNGKKADIISVAKAAKVSASTVSRYFNHPELLKTSTKYSTNHHAKTIRARELKF